MSHIKYTRQEFEKLANMKRRKGETSSAFKARKLRNSPLLNRAVVSRGLRKPR